MGIYSNSLILWEKNNSLNKLIVPVDKSMQRTIRNTVPLALLFGVYVIELNKDNINSKLSSAVQKFYMIISASLMLSSNI